MKQNKQNKKTKFFDAIMSHDILTKTVVVCLIAAVCTFLWGSAFPCVKIGYELFHISSDNVWTQIMFAGVRFALSGVLVIIMGSFLGGKMLLPAKTSWGRLVILALFQTIIQYIFFYIGLARTSGVKSSIIEGANTFVAILIACFLFRQEKLTVKKSVGCLLGFVGVVLVNLTGKGMDMHMTLTGEGFILISTIAYGVSSALIKQFSTKDNTVMLSGYQFLVGGIVLTISGFLGGGRITYVEPKGILMLLYLGCISAVAYTLWGILLAHNPVSKVAVFGFMNPVFGVILSAWWLGERQQAWGLRTFLALLLVCIGIGVVNYNRKKCDEN